MLRVIFMKLTFDNLTRVVQSLLSQHSKLGDAFYLYGGSSQKLQLMSSVAPIYMRQDATGGQNRQMGGLGQVDWDEVATK